MYVREFETTTDGEIRYLVLTADKKVKPFSHINGGVGVWDADTDTDIVLKTVRIGSMVHGGIQVLRIENHVSQQWGTGNYRNLLANLWVGQKSMLDHMDHAGSGSVL